MKEVRGKPVQDRQRHENVDVPIFGPLLLWIGLMLAGVAIQIVFAYAEGGAFVSSYLSDIYAASGYLVYVPGIFILPLMSALWLGHRIGGTDGDYAEIAYRGVINALYAAVIFVIFAFAVYMASVSMHEGVLSTIPFRSFLLFVIAIPSIIEIVVVPMFAVLSSLKRY